MMGAGAAHTIHTAHGAHCGAGGAATATAGGGAGGGEAQVANSIAAIDEKNKLAARGKLVMLKNFILSRVYNRRFVMTI